MNRYGYYSIISFFGLLLFACSTQTNRCITIPTESIEIGDTFSISDFLVEDYDSFYVLPPYFSGNFGPMACEIPGEIRDKAIKRLEMYDDAVVMLFSKCNTIQSYSIIPRNHADFAIKMESLKGISTKSKLTIDSNRQVKTIESNISSGAE